MIPYGRQDIDEKDIAAVVEVLRSPYLTQGPQTKKFEDELTSFCGCEYAVVFNSGTSALHAAYFAAGLGRGDEFIVPAITFVATANAGAYLGADPVFADVEKDTGNIDITGLERAITDRTKMLVPVHYAGNPVRMREIRSLARKHGLTIIEDACHALGAEYEQGRVGNCAYSNMTVFSFHPVKHITTGEGGAVLTRDKGFYDKLMMFRTHGITKDRMSSKPHGDWYYEMQFLGYNYRMTDIQAALGVSQMKKLAGYVARRREIVLKYAAAFAANPYFDLPPETENAKSSYHLYPIRLKDGYKAEKAAVFTRLRENGLGVQVHYIPVYKQPYYRERGCVDHMCPNAEDFYERVISLPLYPAMKDADVDEVVGRVFKTCESFEK